MKCPECKKELNLKLKYCSNCGYPIDIIVKEKEQEIISEAKKIKEEEKKSTKKVKYKENNSEIKKYNFIIDLLISGAFTGIIFLLLAVFKTINSLYSGQLTFFEMLKWCLKRILGLSYLYTNIFVIVIILFLVLALILSATRKKACTVLACVGYSLFTLAVVAFGILLNIADRTLNGTYYLIIGLLIGWVIYLIIRKDRKKVSKVKKENNNSLDEIKEAKELLDNGTITEEEFKLLKNKIINKE